MLVPTIVLLAAQAVQNPAAATAWTATKIGKGGEPYVSTDNEGNVYLSSHIPSQVFVSRDWGKTMKLSRQFGDSLGDVVAFAMPNGVLCMSYMTGYDKGMRTQVSRDYGASFQQGDAPSGRPLDREWMAYDRTRNRLYMVYSDGYIGGPASKGIFLSVSMDQGLTWRELGRVDNEPEGNYAVDPHVAVADDGKVYGFWTVTKDKDTIESYRFATSADLGATFGGHQTLADLPHGLGDRQERWMLGGIAAKGDLAITAFYVAYREVAFDTGKRLSLSVMTRTSTDGGKTFGAPKPVVNEAEARRSAKSVAASDTQLDSKTPWIQVMPWATYDLTGRLHVMWFDNRRGVTARLGKVASNWQLFHTVVDPGKPQRASTAVGESFTALRPALDFLCCAADGKYLHASWSQNVDSLNGWDFTGELWYGRLSLN